jgi:hypothetical protein
VADPLMLPSMRVLPNYRPLDGPISPTVVAENRRRAWFELMARSSGVVPGPDARRGVGALVCRVLPEDFNSPVELRDVVGLRRYEWLPEMFGTDAMTLFQIEFKARGEVLRMPVIVRGEESRARGALEALKGRDRPVTVGIVGRGGEPWAGVGE